jgi:hypothetical protein
VKTNHNQSRRTRMVSNGVILTLLLTNLPDMYADDQRGDNKVVESKLENNIPGYQQPMESETSRRDMVGPSGEEIHDFLYPPPKDSEAVRPVN